MCKAPKANVAKTIEKLMSKNHNIKLSSIHLVDNKAVFANEHWLYCINPKLVKDVNTDYIATPKETAKNLLFKDGKYKRVIPAYDPEDTITITYEALNNLKKTTQEDPVPQYGKKGSQAVGKLEGNKSIIYVVLDNLITACRIFQAGEITLNIYKATWRDIPQVGNKFVSYSPYTVKVNDNLFVCTPVFKRFL